eukprot:gene8397-9083_t
MKHLWRPIIYFFTLLALTICSVALGEDDGERQLNTVHHTQQQQAGSDELSISKTFVINAKYRIDRMQEIKERLDLLRIPFDRFEAVDFKNDVLNPELLREFPRLHNQTRIDLNLVQVSLKKRKEITWEKIGRWQSHVQIYLDIAFGDSLDYPGPFLVLEDNAYLTEKSLRFLTKKYLTKTLPKHWDLLLLDTLFYHCADVANDERYCRAKSAFGIHGYVIKDTDVAVRLCSAFNTPFPRISDFYMSRLIESGKLVAYIPEPDRELQAKMSILGAT